MILTFIGDCHARFQELNEITQNTPNTTIQIGDLGLGFGRDELYKPSKKDLFFRGNHDDPAVCKKFKNCLGEWGYKEEWNLFFLAGGDSIDKQFRTVGLNWWRDEEISEKHYDTIEDNYLHNKPRIVTTHCPPEDLLSLLFKGKYKTIPSKTGCFLSRLFELHKPDLWIFGHMHNSVDMIINNTRFVSLDVLETVELDTETLKIKKEKND